MKAHRIDLTQFAVFEAQGKLQLDRDGVMANIASLHQSYKPRSIRRKIASLKEFFNYFEYEGLVEESPFNRFRLKLDPCPIWAAGHLSCAA